MSLKKIKYIECDKQNHDYEPLSRICVDRECNNKNLVCCICEDQSHKGHQTVPLKKFIEKIGTDTDEFKSLNPLYYSNKIQQMRSAFLNTVACQKSRIIQTFQDLQVQIQIYFNKISQMTANLINMSNAQNLLIDRTQNEKTVKSYFNKMANLVDYQSKEKFSLRKQLELITDSCKEKEKKLITSFQAIKTEIEKNIQKVTQSLDQNAITKTPVFHWSEQFKGHKVKINGTIAEQTNMQSSGQRFAMIQPGLSQFGKRKQCWGIKIKKFVGWVGLGICLRNVIKKANYHFNYTNTGHGSYLISSNGYSWSHSVKQFNSAFKTFQFTVNDIVYIEYDPATWKLRFRKNQGPQNFQLTIDQPPADDSYHPCVNLCSTGDSVEIILPGAPLS